MQENTGLQSGRPAGVFGAIDTITRPVFSGAWNPKGEKQAVDFYEGEYPVAIADSPPYLGIMRASIQFPSRFRREDHKVYEYYQLCKEYGVKTGLYHVLRPHGIKEQIDLFCKVHTKVRILFGKVNLRPVVDVEIRPSDYSISNSLWTEHIRKFIQGYDNEAGTVHVAGIEERLGLSPIIYTSIYFWSFTTQPVWASDYDLWAAWYPYQPDSYPSLPENRMPQGFRRLALWQYAENGRSNGHPYNDYNKMEDWLIEELEQSAPPPPPPPPPDLASSLPSHIFVTNGETKEVGRYDKVE